MKEKPILFSGPMVRAILDGRKTQTRRIIKNLAKNDDDGWGIEDGEVRHSETGTRREPPYCVGMRLWVKETWAHYQTVNHVRQTDGRAFDDASDGLAGYRADGHNTIGDFRQHVRLMSGCDLEHVVVNGDRWRPSIFMPRWASRITLEITDVRVERLQDITEDDAMEEGVDIGCPPHEADQPFPSMLYERLWENINGKDSWEQNPWVWVVSFRKI